MKQRVAVIGSGIAGLAAAWALKAEHEVTLFERHAQLGMDAFSVDVPGGSGQQRIDVPMRVVYEGFYPRLSRLYRDAAIALEPLEYSGTFTQGDGRTYLSYRNLRFGRYAIPMLRGWRALHPKTLPIVLDSLRFFRRVGPELRAGAGEGKTLAEYLRWRGYSEAFGEDFLVPLMAGICTCTYEAVRDYPATTILGYFAAGLFSVPVMRARDGIADVVAKLSAGVHELRLGSPVERIVPHETGVLVRAGGVDSHFDHVVIATQANQALRMLEASDDEREALSSFTYQPSYVVMHTDERLAPPDRRLWGPVNFIMGPGQEMPMATIWMNTVHPHLGATNVFQTWNPTLDPRPEHLISRVAVERPVVNAASLRGLALLEGLHARPGRRVWFCGAYASPGVPLLESATASGLAAAARIDEHAAASQAADATVPR